MAKVNISTASRNKKASFDLSSTHITTLDVGQLRPTYITPLYAGEDIDLKYGQFSRLSPLVAPTFGSFRLKSYAFFCPSRLVFKEYDSFRSGSSDATMFKKPPYITNSQIVACLEKYSGTLMFREDSTSTISVYVVYSPQKSKFYLAVQPAGPYVAMTQTELGRANGFGSIESVMDYVKTNSKFFYSTNFNSKVDALYSDYDFITLHERGADMGLGNEGLVGCLVSRPMVMSQQARWLYNIFLSLGYGVNFGWIWNDDKSTFGDTKFNALPLLSFCRLLYDYIYPSQWVEQQGFGKLFENGEDIIEDKMQTLIDMLLVTYDKDFYTQLWTDFNSPAPGLRQVSSQVPGIDDDQVVSSYKDATSLDAAKGDTALQNLTSQGLRLLQSISDYITRRNIGGSRFREWMKSHFGFVTKEQQSHYSTFLKSWSDEIQISDVTATSADATSVLGEQAGKGIGRSSGSLKFTADQDGYFIILSMVVPIVGYFQGRKPWTLALDTPEDLYNPEFDSLGNQPVRNDELYCEFLDPFNYDQARQGGFSDNGIFGFAPRYNEYKRGFDYLTGDFRFHSRNLGLDAYHTMRVLPMPTKANPLVLDAEFLRVDNQYNRIFAQDPKEDNGASQYDKIFTIFQFNVTAHRHMLTISESIPLFDKQGRDTTVTMNGNSI